MKRKAQAVRHHDKFIVRFPELGEEWRVARANDTSRLDDERPVFVGRSETREDALRLLAVFELRGWRVTVQP